MRRLLAGAGLVALLGSTTACGPTLGDLPLPGTGVSGDTVTLTMDFDNALNLAKGATVKVDGVNGGRVIKVVADDFHAKTTVKIQKSAGMKEGATARLRYTTPLGELYIDVTNPPTGAPIKSGDTLTLQDTSTAPTVEDALSQASLLINGGGLGQLQTVTTELNKALGGKEGTWRDLLAQTSNFMTQVNATSHDIDRALNALNSTSQTLHAREATINRALTEITPAANTLREETPDFTKLLVSLNSFAAQANSTVDASRTNILNAIQEATPTLAALAALQPDWNNSLTQLAALGGDIDRVIPGDWLNLDATVKISPNQLFASVPSGTGGGGTSSGGGLLGGLLGGLTGGTSGGTSGGSTGGSTGGSHCIINLLGVCI